MSHHRFPLASLCCFLLIQPAAVRGQSEVSPNKKYRLDLPARKASEDRFTRDTRTFSADVFADQTTRRLFYVREGNKSLAVLDGQRVAEREFVSPKWLRRFVLQARKWDEEEFGKATRKIGVEVYRDENTSNLVYVSETGSLAVVPESPGQGKQVAEPMWLYRLELALRKSGEDFSRPTRRCNVEIYRHEPTGHLIYLADNGNLAVLEARSSRSGPKATPARWSHGLDLRARKPDQREFRPDTPRVGVEVYDDDNSQATVCVSETFSLAVVPGCKEVDSRHIKAPEWTNGLLSGKWSAEVFHNWNNDHTLIVTHRGALSVLPAKREKSPDRVQQLEKRVEELEKAVKTLQEQLKSLTPDPLATKLIGHWSSAAGVSKEGTGIIHLHLEKQGVCSIFWIDTSKYRHEQSGTGTYHLDWWQTKSGEKRAVLVFNIRTPPDQQTKGGFGFAIEVVSVTDNRLIVRTDFGRREQGGAVEQEIVLDRR
jgi:hypothetical protein